MNKMSKLKMLELAIVITSLGLYIILNPKNIIEVIGSVLMSIGLALIMIEIKYRRFDLNEI